LKRGRHRIKETEIPTKERVKENFQVNSEESTRKLCRASSDWSRRIEISQMSSSKIKEKKKKQNKTITVGSCDI
jgi:hypothetical protein